MAKKEYHSTAPSYASRFTWIRLAHVCRHFRAVALATPRFWSYLQMTKGTTFAELTALSKRAPLHVNAKIADHMSIADWTLALDVLWRHSHHVKELRIDGPTAVIQTFCSKAASAFDILEKLDLTATCSSSSYDGVSSTVAIIASALDAPSHLRHLELRKLPFRWNDPVFSSRNLTTLKVVGKEAAGRHGSSLSDVGSFEELFSALEVVAPRLKVMEITDALPTQGLTTISPTELPRPSRSISFPALRSICLAGDALPLAHVFNHLSLPSTTSLRLTARNKLGGKELAQSVVTHCSLRLLTLCITSAADESLLLSGWTHPQAPALRKRAAPFQLNFGHKLSSRDLLLPIFQGAGNLFVYVQELRLSGTFTLPTWNNVFARFTSVKTLVVDEHPSGDFFLALASLHHVPFPSLSLLDLSRFRFSIHRGQLEPFKDLLDWAIFRCNCSIPVDTIRLSKCKYASVERIEELEDVVVNVRWDDEEMECTTEEDDEEECEEAYGYYRHEYNYGGHLYGYAGGW